VSGGALAARAPALQGRRTFLLACGAPNETGRFALLPDLANRPHPQDIEKRAAAG
jgi:hypothetical protein